MDLKLPIKIKEGFFQLWLVDADNNIILEADIPEDKSLIEEIINRVNQR